MKVIFADVFASERFKGNNAAVCFAERELPVPYMQALAAELAQPVTAFVEPRSLKLRWFTPTVELPLCGHGTVAAAHAIWEGARHREPLRFETSGGPIAARDRDGRIEIDLPAGAPQAIAEPEGLAAALGGAKASWTGHAANKLVVLLEPEATLRALRPDFAALARLPFFGVAVTARGSGQFDFVSRYFAPAHGVDEDPVTGSAHAVLTPFWAMRLGKRELLAYQASARGGVVHARLLGDKAALSGAALTVLRGEIA
jgi:PhzF family phenazine biosynthesis protein